MCTRVCIACIYARLRVFFSKIDIYKILLSKSYLNAGIFLDSIVVVRRVTYFYHYLLQTELYLVLSVIFHKKTSW